MIRSSKTEKGDKFEASSIWLTYLSGCFRSRCRLNVDVVPAVSVNETLQNLHFAECFFLPPMAQNSLCSVYAYLIIEEFADITVYV